MKRILFAALFAAAIAVAIAVASYAANPPAIPGGTMTKAQLEPILWSAPVSLGTITTGFTVSHQDTSAVLTAGDSYTITMGSGVTGRTQIVRLITPPSGTAPTVTFSGNANTFTVDMSKYAANTEVDFVIPFDGTNYNVGLASLAPGPGTVRVDNNGNAQTGLATQTNTKNTAYTVGTDNVFEAYGGVVFVTGTATMTLPAAKPGMSVLVITKGTYAVKIAPGTGEQIDLNGTDLTANYLITNTSTTGDAAACTYEASGKWFCRATSWTGGAS